jgi:iron-sulfur cluster assembly accessory protein
MITLTDAAAAKIKSFCEEEAMEKCSIRIALKGGGCSGFSHDMELSSLQKDNDELFHIKGVDVLIDSISLQYMENVTIDWEESLMTSGFKFTSPDITSSCGCGKSISY